MTGTTKYRAKAVAPQGMTGNWIYGYYCKVQGKHYIILDDAELGMIECTTDFGIMGFVEVDLKTLGQFRKADVIGLDVYEDDIVDYVDNVGKRGVGVIGNSTQGWVIFPKTQRVMLTDVYYAQLQRRIKKILGNTIENPELIEK